MLPHEKPNQKTNLRIWVIMAIIAVFSVFQIAMTQAATGINKQINYQAKLTDDTGAIVPDSNYDIVFKLYTVSSGGTAIWTGNYTTSNSNPVATVRGVFNVLLGSGTGNSLDSIDFSEDTYYLGITVNSDAEMTPRKRLGAAAQAFNANNLIGDGLIRITGAPTGNGAGEGTVYINPGSAASGYTLFGAAVNGAQRFRLDESGNTVQSGTVSASGANFSGLSASSVIFTDASKNLTTTGTVGVAQGGTGTATQFTQGSMIFAGASGAYVQDNANLFWDNTNKRLGIGTNSPSRMLSLFGADNGLRFGYDASNFTDLSVDANGTLTMSTTSSGSTEAAMIIGSGLAQDTSVQFDGYAQDYYAGVNNASGSFMIGSGFSVGTNPLVTITSAGSMGIGDSTPDHMLDIAGNIGLSSGSYINFSDTDGSTGYGIRDNSGNMEYKNSTGSWTAMGTGSGASTFLALTDTPSSFTANRIMFTNSGATALTDNSNFTYDGNNLAIGGSIKLAMDSNTCDSGKEGAMRYNSTSKSVEFCNGTVWGAFGTGSGGGSSISMQTFTSSGTWTKPAGVTKIKVKVVGGGGGGGGGSTTAGGSGGSAGGYCEKIVDVSSISSVSLTVGTAGSAGATSADGGAGGTTSFDTYCSATGGGAGRYNNAPNSPGTGSGGDVNIYGGWGDASAQNSNVAGGNGGSSFFGGGGSGGGSNSNNGQSASAPGAGGGGGRMGFTSTGATGAPGYVIVEEYSSTGTSSSGISLGYQNLRIKNNATTPNTQIDISADYLEMQGYSKSSFSTTINAASVGANGIDAGSLGASTWYYVWGIYNPTTSTMAGLLSTSSTAPTLPSGYTKKRLISMFKTDASSYLIKQSQIDERIDYDARQQIATGLASTSYTTQAVSSMIPTTTNLVREVMFGVTTSGTTTAFFVSDDGVNAKEVIYGSTSTNAIGQENELYVAADASPVFVPVSGDNIYYKVGTSSTFTLYARAYTISLGNGGGAGAGSASFSAFSPATSTNSIDNANFAQTWNWTTASTQNPLTLTADALATGSLLTISSSSGSLNSTNGLVNIANTSSSTSGIVMRVQSNSTAGSGLAVLANGNVGIGTTSPSSLLDLQKVGTVKANNDLLEITNSGNAADMDGTNSSIAFKQFYYDASTPAVVNSGAISVGTETDWTSTAATQDSFLSFSTALDGAVAEKMRLSSGGNLGIGTTGPLSKLSIGGVGSSGVQAYIMGLNTTGSTYGLVVTDSAGTNNFWIRDDGAGYLRAASWSYGSDRRMKENIKDINYGLDTVTKLNPQEFDYISGQKNQLGFIAQEIQPLIPEMVSTQENGMLAIQTDMLIPILTKAIQEQQMEITNDKLQISNEIQKSNDQISSLVIKTDNNVTTLSQLQASIDTQLGVVQKSLASLSSDGKDHGDRIVALETANALYESRIASLEDQMAKLQLVTNQDAINLLNEKMDAISKLITVSDGSIDLLKGTLKASGVETGQLVISVSGETKNDTIGQAVICPAAEKVDSDGKCTTDGKSDTDGKKVLIENSQITDKSKIFTSFENDPGSSTWVEKDGKDGVYTGFWIKMGNAVTDEKGVKVNWWIVEEK